MYDDFQLKKPFGLHGLYKNISALQRLSCLFCASYALDIPHLGIVAPMFHVKSDPSAQKQSH